MLFDHDDFTGITQTFSKDKMTGQVTIKDHQEIGKLFDSNQAVRNGNTGWKGEFHHVASIPLIVVSMWRKELQDMGAQNCDPMAKENKKFLIAKINNGEWSKIRTKEGRI